MLAELSPYYFLFNILLIFVSVLQIAVANETQKEGVRAFQKSKDSAYHMLKSSLSASVAKFRSGWGLSQSSERRDSVETIENSEMDETVDRVFHFLVLNINKITSVLILILSSSFTSLISAVYFLYILFFILFPEKMRRRNSLSMTLLLLSAFLHLAAFTTFQMPFFQESDYCVNSFCIQIWHTIGLTKLVLKDYEGAPVCYIQQDEEVRQVKCENPLSIRGMLPVVLIVILLYFQKMICNSTMYGLVAKSIKEEEKKAEKKREQLLEKVNQEYVRRKEGENAAGG